jgi:subtilase family serine protease
LRALALACLCLGLSGSLWAGQGRQPLRHHVPDEATASALLGDLSPTAQLKLGVSLPLRNQAELEQLIRDLSDPQSPRYRHYLSPSQFAQSFGPTAGQIQALKSFAQAQGLAFLPPEANRLLAHLEGSSAQVNRAFHTRLRRYRHPEGGEFYAPETEPSVDLDLPLLHVAGLDSLARPHNDHVLSPPFSPGARNAQGFAPASGSGAGGNYLGKDLRSVYLPCSSLNGSGQSVALFELDGYYSSDLSSYAGADGIGLPTVQAVPLDSFNGSPGSENIEVALDIEMAMGMAPGLSEIVVYEGNPSQFDPDDILDAMAAPPGGTPLSMQVSSSWFWTGPHDPTVAQIFMRYAAQGQAYFQCSGDLGAYISGTKASAPPPHPAIDSTLMTVVGGTALSTSASPGSYGSETTWNQSASISSSCTNCNSVSGGGICTGLGLPSYQSGFASPSNGASSTWRNIPDVSMVAEHLLIYANNSPAPFGEGGTSAATPLWAAFMAMANQQISPSSVGFANPTLYFLAGNATSYAANFHDINDGSNNSFKGGSSYSAVTGYDLATGLGSPKCALLGGILPSPTPSPTISPTFSVSPSITPTYSISPTFSVSPTRSPTPTVTPTPLYASSSLGKSVLAPVPARQGGPVCLYFEKAPESSQWQIYDLAGELVATRAFEREYQQCWDTGHAAPGIYFVRMILNFADGSQKIMLQKIALTY